MKNLKTTMKLGFALILALAVAVAMGGGFAYAMGKPELTSIFSITLFAASATMFAPAGVLFAIPFTQGLCEKIQVSMNQLLGSKTPYLKRTQVGYLQALKSPMNMAGVSIVPVDPGNGKNRSVRIKFIQRAVEGDIITAVPANCDIDNYPSPFEQTVAITKYIATKGVGFNEDEMRKLCEADSEYRASVMSAQIDALMKVLNKQLITLQAANFGRFNPDVPVFPAPKPVTLLNGVLRQAVYSGEADIAQDFSNLDSNDRPIVVGSGILSNYARQINIGCCNEIGQDLSQAGKLDFFEDRFVEGILGANQFIGLVPGYVQLLTWNKYVASYFKENDKFSKGTVMDPVTGIVLDMKWIYDECAEEYVVRLSLNYELYFIPANSFAAADELNGVNFTLRYLAVAV